MNEVIILMGTDQEYYETGRFSSWYLLEQMKWWDEIFNIKFVDFRKRISGIAKKTLERANADKIYPYANDRVLREIVSKHNAWVVLFDDDDFFPCAAVEFLRNCNDYDKLVHWSVVINFPFGSHWEDPSRSYDFLSEKTFCRVTHSDITSNTLYNGAYAMHTSNNSILPWETSVCWKHLATRYIKNSDRLFVSGLDSVYTGLGGWTRLRAARNRQDLCNFISFFKTSYLEYPQEFKQEEILVNELMKSIELTERGRQLGLRLSKASSNSVVSLL